MVIGKEIIWRAIFSMIAFSTFAVLEQGSQARAHGAVRAQRTVLVEAQGRCSLHATFHSPEVCKHSLAGNAQTGGFPTRKTWWGIAFAYNCGVHSGDFFFVVGLPSLAHGSATPPFLTRGRMGRGYWMVPPSTAANLQDIPNGWANVENITIRSVCAWHVRGVLGTKVVVKRYVPKIPPLHPRASSWTTSVI